MPGKPRSKEKTERVSVKLPDPDRLPVKITLPPYVREMGDKLAREDKRGDLSHEVEWLIEDAFVKRFGKQAA